MAVSGNSPTTRSGCQKFTSSFSRLAFLTKETKTALRGDHAHLSVCLWPSISGKWIVGFSWNSVQKFLTKIDQSEFNDNRRSYFDALLKRVNEFPPTICAIVCFGRNSDGICMSLKELFDSMILKTRQWNIVATYIVNGNLAMNFWTLMSDTWTSNHT
jgi:hypothetical protein